MPAVPAPESAPAKHARPHAARSEDPSRIVAAIQALRTEHDPDRAATLVAEYLKVYPQGALAEEALALSIEAAAARHNPAAASAFAEQYLKRYPNGRFRRAAEQARRTSAP
jgi:outer membrane protein assembly factor BamD (BamD/ComL family)